MRKRQTMTVSLPEEMVEKVEKVRKAEHRTRSELVREALRVYFSSRLPTVTASSAELRAIRRGRRAHERGEYVTLDEILHAMGSPRRPTGRKGA
jgi:predicted transcriptional regulator